MKTLLLAVFFCSIFIAPQIQSHAAERGLLEPDWNDPVIARAARNNPLLAPHVQTPGEAQAPLSLPRWGFSKNIDSPTSDERARSRIVQPSGGAPAWPNCASKTPKLEHVRDKTGVWYTDNYNFGCLIISVSGDRAYSPDLKVPSSLAQPDDCSEQARAAAPAADEGDARSRFELQISLNRLPYSIVGRCLEGAQAFCRSRTAQCALVGRLIFLEGSPQ